jgi:hypothetical protein
MNPKLLPVKKLFGKSDRNYPHHLELDILNHVEKVWINQIAKLRNF